MNVLEQAFNDVEKNIHELSVKQSKSPDFYLKQIPPINTVLKETNHN
jgi:hypothetical protein